MIHSPIIHVKGLRIVSIGMLRLTIVAIFVATSSDSCTLVKKLPDAPKSIGVKPIKAARQYTSRRKTQR